MYIFPYLYDGRPQFGFQLGEQLIIITATE